MIDNLISGREFSPFVVIKDTLAAPGDNLLLCWTQQLRKRFSRIVAIHCGMTNRGYETFDIDCLAGMECKQFNIKLNDLNIIFKAKLKY